MGVQGAHLDPGSLLTHLHTVYMAYSECLPTRLNPLAERTFFSQVGGLQPAAYLAGCGGGLWVRCALDVKVILTPPCIHVFH
jgi:hypothetical protein